jgi:hypothetical protein
MTNNMASAIIKNLLIFILSLLDPFKTNYKFLLTCFIISNYYAKYGAAYCPLQGASLELSAHSFDFSTISRIPSEQ